MFFFGKSVDFIVCVCGRGGDRRGCILYSGWPIMGRGFPSSKRHRKCGKNTKKYTLHCQPTPANLGIHPHWLRRAPWGPVVHHGLFSDPSRGSEVGFKFHPKFFWIGNFLQQNRKEMYTGSDWIPLKTISWADRPFQPIFLRIFFRFALERMNDQTTRNFGRGDLRIISNCLIQNYPINTAGFPYNTF